MGLKYCGFWGKTSQTIQDDNCFWRNKEVGGESNLGAGIGRACLELGAAEWCCVRTEVDLGYGVVIRTTVVAAVVIRWWY